MDFNQEKKLLVDKWSIAANDMSMFFGFQVGNEKYAFVLYPPGAKTFLQNLQKVITAYEEKNGVIDESLSQVSHMSPIQRS